MNCREIEKFLPLYAGHDLSARREQSIAAHLQSCAACSAAAAEYREARDLLHAFTPPAFSDETYAGIRQRVWEQIEIESGSPSLLDAIAAWFQPRLVWTTVAALLVIVSVVGVYFSVKRFSVRQEAIAVVPETVPQSPDGPGEEVAADPANPDKKNTGPRRADIPRRQRGPGRLVAPDQAGSVVAYAPDAQRTKSEPTSPIIGTEDPDLGSRASAGTLRMELQTRDPNIRIIWFTQRDSKPVAHSKGT
jgi:hypothetical protein